MGLPARQKTRQTNNQTTNQTNGGKIIMDMDTFKVTFTPEKLAQFKAELAKHPDKNSVFKFEDKEWLVHYAQYLAEYLDGIFLAKQMLGKPVEYKGEAE
jgi:hypothetical protein